MPSRGAANVGPRMKCRRLSPAAVTLRQRRTFAMVGVGVVGILAAVGAAAQEASPQPAESGPFLYAAARFLAAEPGRTEEALDLFEQAVAADPEAPFLRIGFAEFLGRLRRVEEAAEHAAVAYRLAPDDVDVLRRYGRIQMGLASGGSRLEEGAAVDSAVEALEKLREIAPSDIEGMLLLYQLLRALEEPARAAAVLEELVSYHNGNR